MNHTRQRLLEEYFARPWCNTYRALAEVVWIDPGQRSHEQRENVCAAFWVMVAGGDEAASHPNHTAEGRRERVRFCKSLHSSIRSRPSRDAPNTHTHTNTHTNTRTHMHTHTHTHTYTHTHTHIDTHIYIHTHRYTYIHSHTHIYKIGRAHV